MNISNYYWYFSGVLTPRFCNDVIAYANEQKEVMARTGGYGDRKLNKQEVLNLKRKHFEYISSPNSPKEQYLKFTIWGTKTKPIHYPIANDWFTKHIFPEINNRHISAELKDDDYLLFPFKENRKLLKHKTGKTFARFSKDLKLFYHKGGTRPLYSIRHTYATELYKKGTTMDDIAELMNTSARMVMSVYLGHTDQSLINLAKRIPSKLKLIK